MTSKPEQVDPSQVADERLTGAHDLALAALHEITAADTVGPAAGYTLEEDGVVSLRFHTRLSGYPGWFWTVSVAVVEESDPTVLEVELLPGDGALLAPDWVPWATRLAEYQAAQAAAAAAGAAEDADDEDAEDEDAEDDTDDDDDEDEPKARFHAGDLDGVDIDELDADRSAGDESDDDDSDDDESDDDDSDDDDSDDDEPDEDDADDDFDEDDDERERSY
ncbi:Protein of unknown function [Microbacterium sp. ru370.1]|uniref:DUF3027 domain-containing protein n=1 Tax=unclassified Microbacterium TaxID=2609290 RepID=UPI00088757BA|nr:MULTISPECIES: DUF3027 domain-containing protein [unclassified Microbacterium]SDP00327.1 Protein of unknown function [Microbacterium sp. ru370.1]SIT92319.1 Protein of unknown function [Microbacterium sp. RU1D]